MSDDLVTWFEEANGFAQGTKAPHKWVLQAEQELRFQGRRIEELEAEVARLRLLVPRPDQTEDELVWRDHMRGVPLAALAKEFGCTKERMRYRLKKITENKLHLTGGKDD